MMGNHLNTTWCNHTADHISHYLNSCLRRSQTKRRWENRAPLNFPLSRLMLINCFTHNSNNESVPAVYHMSLLIRQQIKSSPDNHSNWMWTRKPKQCACSRSQDALQVLSGPFWYTLALRIWKQSVLSCCFPFAKCHVGSCVTPMLLLTFTAVLLGNPLGIPSCFLQQPHPKSVCV